MSTSWLVAIPVKHEVPSPLHASLWSGGIKPGSGSPDFPYFQCRHVGLPLQIYPSGHISSSGYGPNDLDLVPFDDQGLVKLLLGND